ncbi:hypothetical protein [Microvirga sp. 2TAF3]|uniref:hypothetical protein n=1 Tax=Microvirga sp. 2TAF3 TaxID=3233014 RepID=UPI003F94E9BF
MLQFLKVRQGRKAAIATIAPLVERSRTELGEIPRYAWHDAYLLGFLVMLVSLEARRIVGSLNSHALGLVQTQTLAELSGEPASIYGEEIFLFSVNEDPEFHAGCYQACVFHRTMRQHGWGYPDENPQDDLWEPDRVDVEMTICQLWFQLFEGRLASLS